jgi:hypothetical protein
MVCGIAGFTCCFVPSILGIVFGFIARNRIKKSNGTLQGAGMATAGIICGLVAVALFVVYILIVAISGSFSSS